MNGDVKGTLNGADGVGRTMRAILLIGVIVFALDWVGCSVEKHYKLLSKFFDGVPDPNEKGSLDGLEVSKSPTFSMHKPFAEDACSECHPNPSEMLLTKNDSSICMKCHTDIKDEYAMMHGAVTGTACLMCHNPHLSPLVHLLRQEAPGLCLQCHDMETPNPILVHQDLTQDCRTCHHAHGGDNQFFLIDNMSEEHAEPEELGPTTSDDS